MKLHILKNCINKAIIILFILLCTQISTISQNGYRIDVSVKELDYSPPAILSCYYGNTMMIKDTAFIDKEGNGFFTGPEKLPEGMYTIYLGPGKIFDIFLSDDQNFTLKYDPNSMNFKAEGSVDNTLLFDYIAYMVKKNNEMNILLDKKIRSTSKSEKDSINQLIIHLNIAINKHVKKCIKDNKNTFFATFIQATRDIEIPNQLVNKNHNYLDSLYAYNYYAQHFFDNFDLSDSRLLRTPIYNEKVEYYLTRVVIPVSDSLINAIDFLIESTEKDKELFKNMLSLLMLYFTRNNMIETDEAFVYLAEKYYLPKAYWATSETKELLKKKVNEKKRILIGHIAPDFEVLQVEEKHFKAAAKDPLIKADTLEGTLINMHSIEAEYTILYFWEADCGHCKEATSELYNIYQEKLKPMGVKVLSVQMLTGKEGKEKWVDYINGYTHYKWINAWQPTNYSYKELYDLRYSPILYILDKEKRIIAKNVLPKQLEEIITMYIKKL